MERSNSESGARVRISDVKRRQRKPPRPKAGGVGLSIAKGVLRGPSAAGLFAYTAGELLETLLFFVLFFFYLILSESLPGIPDVFT